MEFHQLGLMDPILKALAEQGYIAPTPIQRNAIPPALKGQDVLGCAQTGTGKTCAFATPILQRLNGRNGNPRAIRALVLTPTRELALQIQESFTDYGKYLSLRSAVIFGGVGQQPQVDRLKKGVDILVATPGRLLDLHGQKFLDLSQVEIFVLDEADRMLDMGFIHDVRRVLQVLPPKKQTLLFSATMPPEVMELVNGLLHDYQRVEVDPISSPVEVIRQSLYYVDKGNKTKLLAHLIHEKGMDSVLVFSRTKHGANRIAGDLAKRGITAAAIHGNKSQTARQQALFNFKTGQVTALVATDIAARGIDIDELKWVINYDLPEVPETYVHRIGRTGRAGNDGAALSFCRADEKEYLKQIERLLGKALPVVEGHPFPMSEPPTGIDPMTQARWEGKENARANRDRRRKNQQTTSEGAVPVIPVSPPSPRQGGKKGGRGIRQGNLEATLPTTPATPSNDFVRPNPMDGDTILDATARLLAPRSRMFDQSGRRIDTISSQRESGQKYCRSWKKEGSENAPAPSSQPTPARKGKPSSHLTRKERKDLPQSKKTAGTPSPTPKGSGRGRRVDRPRPIEHSLYSAHQKDSTEQVESIIKPYYLSDD